MGIDMDGFNIDNYLRISLTDDVLVCISTFLIVLIAKKFFNGGGHFNASGGKIDNFKESFIYADIKETIEQIFRGENDE